MPVRIQSGQTVDIDRAIQDGFADIENAGTLTNAGTTIDITQDKISLPAATSGTGSGLGSAVNPAEKSTVASGIGTATGTAFVVNPEFIRSGQTIDVDRVIRQGFDAVKNAGTLTNAGEVTDVRQRSIALPAATNGQGQLFGQATTSRFTDRQASGIGETFGQATTSRLTDRQASGIGQGLGTAIEKPFRLLSARGIVTVNTGNTKRINSGQTIQTPQIQNAGTVINAGTTQFFARGLGSASGQATPQEKRFKQASGIGEGFGQATKIRTSFRQATGIGQGLGTAIENPFRLAFAGRIENVGPDGDLVVRFGLGEGFGQANPLTLFDPIQHMVGILNDITASELSLPKPERIAPIWEYSHNDRINFPKPALYVYAPTEATIDKFSIDADTTNQTNTIEILIMTLEQERTRAYQQNFVRYLTQFYDDNQTETGFHRFANITASDIRNEHITQQTDHYIASVTVEVQKFTDI
jgi:hypothetical protein